MLFKWKEEYATGIEEIDNQHRNLLNIGAKLYDKISRRDEDHYDEILNLIDELRDYTMYHFGYEEKLLAEVGFEYFDDHKMEHDVFIQKVNEIDDTEIDINQGRFMMNLIVFIADWIEKHILDSDHKYKEVLKEAGY